MRAQYELLQEKNSYNIRIISIRFNVLYRLIPWLIYAYKWYTRIGTLLLHLRIVFSRPRHSTILKVQDLWRLAFLYFLFFYFQYAMNELEDYSCYRRLRHTWKFYDCKICEQTLFLKKFNILWTLHETNFHWIKYK